MKVFFLPSYVSRAPSTRMRVYKVAEFLQKLNQPLEILPYNLTVEEKHKRLVSIQPGDILYVQKWRTEFNSVAHIEQYKGKCKIVFDLDDLTGDKVALDLINISDALVVGNHYLFQRHNDGSKPVFIVPSAVDINEYPKFTKEGPLSISLAKCGITPMLGPLGKLKDALLLLRSKCTFDLILAGFNDEQDVRVIKSMFPFAKCLPLLTYDEYLNKTVPVLQTTTVGISPFTKRDEGKSGHSALANLAMGIPCCAAPYAECNHIIEDGVNGFLVGRDEWQNKIEILFGNPDLRMRFREAGWKTIRDKYDVPIVAQKLLDYLRMIE